MLVGSLDEEETDSFSDQRPRYKDDKEFVVSQEDDSEFVYHGHSRAICLKKK